MKPHVLFMSSKQLFIALSILLFACYGIYNIVVSKQQTTLSTGVENNHLSYLEKLNTLKELTSMGIREDALIEHIEDITNVSAFSFNNEEISKQMARLSEEVTKLKEELSEQHNADGELSIAEISEFLSSAFAVEAAILAELHTINKSTGVFNDYVMTSSFIVILLLLISLYLFRSIYLSSHVAPLKRINERLKLMMSISDEETLNTSNKSSINETERLFDTFSARINKVLDDAKNGIEKISDAITKVSDTSKSLSQSSSEQASSIEQTSTSLLQLATSINQNTENANNTSKIAIETSAHTEEGGAAVNNTVDAMHNISSKIGVIEDIAYKTNLLALNAAIEAARAGEQGKGFAVVADEVRKLAERSQIAAKEISELSLNSVKISENAGELIGSIVPNIQKTAELISEINSSSIEQSNSVNQINIDISKLDRTATHGATASVELSNLASDIGGQLRDVKLIIESLDIESSGFLHAQLNDVNMQIVNNDDSVDKIQGKNKLPAGRLGLKTKSGIGSNDNESIPGNKNSAIKTEENNARTKKMAQKAVQQNQESLPKTRKTTAVEKVNKVSEKIMKPRVSAAIKQSDQNVDRQKTTHLNKTRSAPLNRDSIKRPDSELNVTKVNHEGSKKPKQASSKKNDDSIFDIKLSDIEKDFVSF